MRIKTGVHWLDAYVEQADEAGAPETMDLESGRLLYSRIIPQDVPMPIYRRLPISYQLIHGRARQRPEDVIAAAIKMFAETPVRHDTPPCRDMDAAEDGSRQKRKSEHTRGKTLAQASERSANA
jgi:hypothetical protein